MKSLTEVGLDWNSLSEKAAGGVFLSTRPKPRDKPLPTVHVSQLQPPVPVTVSNESRDAAVDYNPDRDGNTITSRNFPPATSPQAELHPGKAKSAVEVNSHTVGKPPGYPSEHQAELHPSPGIKTVRQDPSPTVPDVTAQKEGLNNYFNWLLGKKPPKSYYQPIPVVDASTGNPPAPKVDINPDSVPPKEDNPVINTPPAKPKPELPNRAMELLRAYGLPVGLAGLGVGGGLALEHYLRQDKKKKPVEKKASDMAGLYRMARVPDKVIYPLIKAIMVASTKASELPDMAKKKKKKREEEEAV